MTTRELYRDYEFAAWAQRRGLIFDEDFLVRNYLQRSKKTLEAGTGGGRILLELEQRGFKRLWGFDIVPEFIAAAQQKQTRIQFSVQDAVALDYPDESFEQIIYLQQILCFVDGDRHQAITEANRVLSRGGVALFSFLCLQGSQTYRKLFQAYIATRRCLLGIRRDPQVLPWLKRKGRWNWSALLDKSPYCYWYRVDQAVSDLQQGGFQVVAFGASAQIRHGGLFKQWEEAAGARIKGMLYCICVKP